jgi:prepilin-type N-terminal cleavage/methylation domain-containing protein
VATVRGRRLAGQQGLTLIEMLMGTALATVIFMVLYTILNMALNAYEVGQVRSAAVQGGRITLVRMLDEIRYARSIYIAGSDQIDFLTLIEKKSGISGSVFDSLVVHYCFDAGTGIVSREEDRGGAKTLLDDVVGLTFTYREADLDSIINPQINLDRIRFVEIDLRLRQGHYMIPLRTLVTLDNPLRFP